jgi:hypothetical protein
VPQELRAALGVGFEHAAHAGDQHPRELALPVDARKVLRAPADLDQPWNIAGVLCRHRGVEQHRDRLRRVGLGDRARAGHQDRA